MGASTEIDLVHANLPAHVDTASARLPQSYEAAKTALAECERIDECQTWADKMAALASYARQVEDESLIKTAMRIHGRALRRAGQLLQEVSAGREQGGRPPGNGGGAPTVSQRQAASAAGMSKDQQVTAVRVARVPAAEFKAAIESDNPPTVTALAEAGKKPMPDLRQGADQRSFTAASRMLGALEDLTKRCSEHPPEVAANGVRASEVTQARQLVVRIDAWLSRFLANLNGINPQ